MEGSSPGLRLFVSWTDGVMDFGALVDTPSFSCPFSLFHLFFRELLQKQLQMGHECWRSCKDEH